MTKLTMFEARQFLYKLHRCAVHLPLGGACSSLYIWRDHPFTPKSVYTLKPDAEGVSHGDVCTVVINYNSYQHTFTDNEARELLACFKHSEDRVYHDW